MTDSLTSTVEKVDDVTINLNVNVPWTAVQSDLNATFKEVAKHAHVKGFRPGKVPPKMIRKIYGKRVRADVAERLVQKGISSAVEEHAIDLVARPEVTELPDVKNGEDFSFVAKIEVKPEIKSVKTDGLEAWREPDDEKEVAESVEQEIKRLRVQHSELQAPEPMRPAKLGDSLTVNYTVSVDGQEKDEMGATDRNIELDEDALLPEFVKGLVGAEVDKETTFSISFDDDHQDADLQGKTAEFKLTISKLHERLLPELDDEFAKDCGDFETLDELKKDIRGKIVEGNERQRESLVKNQLIDALIEKNEIAVPPSLVKEQADQLMYQRMMMLQMMGPSALGELGDEDEVQKRAERRVRGALLLGALAKQEKIEIDDADLDAEFLKLAEKSGKHVAQIKAQYQGEKRGELVSQLLQDKLDKFLLTKATINEGKIPEKK